LLIKWVTFVINTSKFGSPESESDACVFRKGEVIIDTVLYGKLGTINKLDQEQIIYNIQVQNLWTLYTQKKWVELLLSVQFGWCSVPLSRSTRCKPTAATIAARKDYK